MKRIISLFLCCLFLSQAPPAHSETWADLIAQLDDSQLIAVFQILSDEMAKRGFSSPVDKTLGDVMVWIPKSGKKYHKQSGCSNMKNPIHISLEEAKYAGYEPCAKCKPPT